MADPTLELARQLIARRSLTPQDAGCLELIAARLEPLGFRSERISANGVDNLWARRGTAARVNSSCVRRPANNQAAVSQKLSQA